MFYACEVDSPYTLGEDSLYIDAGTTDFSLINLPDFKLPAYDLAGNPRIYGDQVDLGAYEWQGQSGSEEQIVMPDFRLTNYPNPFNPITNIKFEIPDVGLVRLSVYNLKGQKIKELLDQELSRGVHHVTWDGQDEKHLKQSSGVYLFKLESKGKSLIHKAIMMK